MEHKSNLYKLVFVGTEPEMTIIAGTHPVEETKTGKTLHNIYQTYLWAENSALAIEEVRSEAEQAEIEIEDFTKISLVVSARSIGRFSKELIGKT